MDERSFVIWLLVQRVERLENSVDGLITRTDASQ